MELGRATKIGLFRSDAKFINSFLLKPSLWCSVTPATASILNRPQAESRPTFTAFAAPAEAAVSEHSGSRRAQLAGELGQITPQAATWACGVGRFATLGQSPLGLGRRPG